PARRDARQTAYSALGDTSQRPPPSPRRVFFFNDTATTEIYTLSLHDALPIFLEIGAGDLGIRCGNPNHAGFRSEEHTSELQSLTNLVCRLLLEKTSTNKT